jgi:hypothetical protein
VDGEMENRRHLLVGGGLMGIRISVIPLMMALITWLVGSAISYWVFF